MIVEQDVQLDYSDVLLKPKRTTLNSRSEPNIYREYKMKWTGDTLVGNGLMVANMATTGTFDMAKVLQKHKMFTCLHKHYTFEELKDFLQENNFNAKTFDDRICGNEYVFVSTGIKDGDYEKICKVLDLGLCKNLCIDIANGYIPNLLKFVKNIREKYPHLHIMVGNVVTGDMTQDLILNGADIVKLGIGPGSVCTTRKLTGVGRPMLSTVIECADAAHGVGGMVCADGGCVCPGDIVKAYGAGADFVMIGGMLAGTDEASGELIEKVYRTNEYSYDIEDFNVAVNNSNIEDKILEADITLQYAPDKPKYELKKFKKFYGMSSKLAQDKHWGGMAKYRASEGKVVEVPYTGSAEEVIANIKGGLRSAMTYLGAKRLKDIPKCATFYKVNHQLNNVFGKE